MARTIYQTNVILAREKDSFESQLNHFLSTLETDNFVEIQYQESSGTFSALVLLGQAMKNESDTGKLVLVISPGLKGL